MSAKDYQICPALFKAYIAKVIIQQFTLGDRITKHMEDYSLTFEIDAEASKELIDKIKQDTEDQLNSIQQHFEERWQEDISNKIQLDGNISEEAIMFAKSVFLYGCNVGWNVGWNNCYMFHEDLIQKGLNQQ